MSNAEQSVLRQFRNFLGHERRTDVETNGKFERDVPVAEVLTEKVRRLSRSRAGGRVPPEFQQDFEILRYSAERAAAVIIASLSDPSKAAPAEQTATMSRILDDLNDASNERKSVADAWTHLNAADAYLPLVIPPKDLPTADCRMRIWDSSLRKDLKDVLDRSGAAKQVDQLLSRTPDQDPLKVAVAPGNGHSKLINQPRVTAPTPEEEPIWRAALHSAGLVRAGCWNEQNRRVEALGRLWTWASALLVGALTATLTLTWLIGRFDAAMQLRLPEFFLAPVVGFFGGTLSAYLKATTSEIEVSSPGLVVWSMLLRSLLGAAGAFVVITAALTLPLGELSTLVATNGYAFILAGVAAGFSERLFVDALEKAAGNLGTISKSSTGPTPSPAATQPG